MLLSLGPPEVKVETGDAIRSRRNVRSYSDRAISPPNLDQILEAARRTPSAGNQQGWDLVVGSAHSAVSDHELARRLLGFPEDRFCAWLMSLGTPADRPLTPVARPARRPFEDVVHRGHW